MADHAAVVFAHPVLREAVADLVDELMGVVVAAVADLPAPVVVAVEQRLICALGDELAVEVAALDIETSN